MKRKIQNAIDDPNWVTHFRELTAGFSPVDLLILQQEVNRNKADRARWAHHQRQLDPQKQFSYEAWRLGRR
jgi:hypothetical protein